MMFASAQSGLFRVFASSFHLPLREAVAFTGRLFQFLTVNNFDLSATGRDNSGLLQTSCCYGHTGTARAEHLS